MLLELLRSPAVTSSPLAHALYRPRLTRHDRHLWDQADAIRQYWISRGDRYLTFPWPDLTEEMYAEFRETGRRSPFEPKYLRRRQIVCTLALAEGYENEGRFLPRLVETILGLCDERTWVLPAHAGDQVDIFSTETANLLAWVAYLFGDTRPFMDSKLVERVRQETEVRVLQPYLSRDDYWWMALNGEAPSNWTTWCTSNCLGTALLLEGDRDRRWQVLEKACRSLDRFLAAYAEDGGCEEGPMYWNFAAGCLFDSLEMLFEASDGAFDVFAHPGVRNIGTFISKVHVHDLHFLSFADSLPQVPVDAALMYRYGRRLGEPHMQALAAHIHRLIDKFDVEDTLRLKLYRALATLPDTATLDRLAAPPVAPRDSYLPKLEVMIAREDERAGHGFVLAAQGGSNVGGHNHNDVGNFVVYLDGRPVLIDVGMKEYSKESFDNRRYDIWAMQSAYHNVPMINGCSQAPGAEFAARHSRFEADSRLAEFQVDIAAAYPAGAGIEKWHRRCVLLRTEHRIRIEDEAEFKREDNSYELRFLTLCRPLAGRDGLVISLDPDTHVLLQVGVPGGRTAIYTISLQDRRLRHVWGETIYQIRVAFDGVPRTARAVTAISRLGSVELAQAEPTSVAFEAIALP
jgi:hypothetical protein